MAHPELNLTWMVWDKVKRNLATRNLKFQLNSVEEGTILEIKRLSADEFRVGTKILLDSKNFKDLKFGYCYYKS